MGERALRSNGGEVAIVVPTSSAASTRRVAAALAQLLAPPACLLLEGPLGAGKTTFVRGFVDGLGGAALRVQSPTFALAHTYPTVPPVHHLDLYRLEGEDAAFDLGLSDLVSDPDAFACVEWAERAPGLFAGLRRVRIRFPENASRSRRLVVSLAPGDALASEVTQQTLVDAARHRG